MTLAWTAANAIPARRDSLTVTLADGRAHEVVLAGDEHFHYYIDRNGETFMELDGSVSKADVKSILSARAMASRSGGNTGLFEGSAFPRTGSPKVLVVLVEYADVPFHFAEPYDYFSRLLSEEGFSDFGATGSALDFFRESSGGRFTPEFDLYGPLTLEHERAYYGGNNGGGQDTRPWEMVIEACRQLDATVDFNDYDCDGDGLIDNVFVFYAGRGEATSGGASTVWPHSADIMMLEPDAEYTIDGVRLNRYACTNEWNISRSIGPRPDGIGTFVHEFSHVMGLPDLYATDYSNAFTPGAWSTMDYGPYNNDGCTPPLYSAFERYALGWLEPTVISGPAEIEIAPIGENQAYIIPTSKPEEYFLLENRQQQSWDTYLPYHGMLVWHVDYVADIWNRNCVNNDAAHQYVDLEEADNHRSLSSLEGDPFPGTGNVTEFGDNTLPSMRTWTKERLNLPLSEIRETPDGMITLKVKGGYTAIEGIGGDDSTLPAAVYSLTGIRVASVAPGESLPQLAPGVYIINRGGKTSKIIIR